MSINTCTVSVLLIRPFFYLLRTFQKAAAFSVVSLCLISFAKERVVVLLVLLFRETGVVVKNKPRTVGGTHKNLYYDVEETNELTWKGLLF